MGNYKKKMGPKGRQRDIDSNYLKGAHSWNERMLKYSELCSLDFYLIKYEVFIKYKLLFADGIIFRRHLKEVLTP